MIRSLKYLYLNIGRAEQSHGVLLTVVPFQFVIGEEMLGCQKYLNIRHYYGRGTPFNLLKERHQGFIVNGFDQILKGILYN